MFCAHLFTICLFHSKPVYKENNKLSHYDNRLIQTRIVSLGLGVNGDKTDEFSSSEGESDILLQYKIYTIRIRCPVRHYGQKGCLDGKNRNEKACQIVAKSGQPSTLYIQIIWVDTIRTSLPTLVVQSIIRWCNFFVNCGHPYLNYFHRLH